MVETPTIEVVARALNCRGVLTWSHPMTLQWSNCGPLVCNLTSRKQERHVLAAHGAPSSVFQIYGMWTYFATMRAQSYAHIPTQRETRGMENYCVGRHLSTDFFLKTSHPVKDFEKCIHCSEGTEVYTGTDECYVMYLRLCACVHEREGIESVKDRSVNKQ